MEKKSCAKYSIAESPSYSIGEKKVNANLERIEKKFLTKNLSKITIRLKEISRNIRFLDDFKYRDRIFDTRIEKMVSKWNVSLALARAWRFLAA